MVRKKPTKEKQREYQARYHAKNPGLKAIWNKKWIVENRERFNASKYHYRDRVKVDVINHYSDGQMCCAYCGYSNIKALCIDHIDNDGAQWRKTNKVASRSGQGINSLEALKKLGYPPGLQVLCANCNLIKEIERKMVNRHKNQWYKYGN